MSEERRDNFSGYIKDGSERASFASSRSYYSGSNSLSRYENHYRLMVDIRDYHIGYIYMYCLSVL
jgi:hypothetical protein